LISSFYIKIKNSFDFFHFRVFLDCIGAVIVSMLVLSAVDCEIEAWSDKINDYLLLE